MRISRILRIWRKRLFDIRKISPAGFWANCYIIPKKYVIEHVLSFFLTEIRTIQTNVLLLQKNYKQITIYRIDIMRGGARPGAGRPKIYGKRVQLSILISEETKTKLKELAKAHDKPLASVVEQLIINEYAGTMLMS